MNDTTAVNTYDLFVIGGGVNGCGIARDAAGRGYSVLLAEMHDLASGTSSAATKLVHGGLRYLEHYEFRLVHESLAEREVLWASAPHIIRPLRFVLPHHKGLRPAWFLRVGLMVYDTLGGRRLLPPTETLDLTTNAAGKPLKPGFRTGFEYSDCWVDDARLVALCARDAADRGGDIRTRTRVVSARREDGLWTVVMRHADGATEQVRARLLVNAAGPWVDRVITEAIGVTGKRNVRLVKGSHIVVPRLFEHDRCYIFQNADGRIVFAIPYEDDFTLIGTTDEDYEGDPGAASISAGETAYLCSVVSEYLREPVRESQVVWTYSGVRPLFDDGASAAQEATRDYVIRTAGGAAEALLVNIFGGKLTTFRRLSEEVVDKVAERLGVKGRRWTRKAQLPGGEFPPTGFAAELAGLVAGYPDLDPTLLRRLCRQYGTRARMVLGAARQPGDLGEDFGAGLHAAEVDYLIDNEWARSAEDVLWRRTKLGLRVDADAAGRIDAHIAARVTLAGASTA